jgi:hypothetical protein
LHLIKDPKIFRDRLFYGHFELSQLFFLQSRHQIHLELANQIFLTDIDL